MWITLSRMAMAPFILGLMAWDSVGAHIAAALLFIIASITDYFDGYYARKFNAVSNMGKFMDPIADKILVSSILIALIPSHRIDIWMVIILIARDTLVGGLRSVAAADHIVIAAQSAGKWKTALQMIAIPLLILDENFFGLPVLTIGYTVLWVTVILSGLSGFDYLMAYRRAKQSA